MSTLAVLKTACMFSSHRICRLSLGSWRSLALIYSHNFLTTWGRDNYRRSVIRCIQYRKPSTAYLGFSAHLGQRVAEVERLSEPASCLALPFLLGIRAATFRVTVAIVADSFGALFLGCLNTGLGFLGTLGHAPTSRCSTSGQSVLLGLQFGRKSCVSVLCGAFALLLLLRWREGDLNLSIHPGSCLGIG